MARSAVDDENEDKPLDPAVEKVRRKLVRFIAINLGLLAVALMAVLGAIVYKSRTPEAPIAIGAVSNGEIVLPVGARILSHSIGDGRISIDAELADGSRTIFLYSSSDGRLVGTFAVKNK